MRKVIVTEFVTLDGLMSDPNDQMEWVLSTFDDEMGREIAAQQASVDTMLLGRLTYEIFARYWPTATTETEDPATIAHMNDTAKVVFSRTLDRVAWANARLVRDGIVDEVRRLKALPGKDIAIVGSASIVQQLANHALVEEYQLLVHPVVLGKGKPLFAEIEDRQHLKLTQADWFKNGVLSLRYEPAA
jgi:dihydrofolate reductase